MPSLWERQPWMEPHKLLNWIKANRRQHQNNQGAEIMKRLRELRDAAVKPGKPDGSERRFL